MVKFCILRAITRYNKGIEGVRYSDRLTVLIRLDLDDWRSSALTAARLGRHLDVVDGVGGEVLHEVGGARRLGGDAHVLVQVRVVEVDVVVLDQLLRAGRWRPRQSDFVRRDR